MGSSNNIILFPIRSSDRYIPPQTIEEVIENMADVRNVHIQESLENMMPMLFDRLSLAGFNLDDEDPNITKHGALVVEAVRSFLCRVYGMEHPLQIIANNLFETDDDGNLSIAENVRITITNDSEIKTKD
jgi:hypothetical protein